MILTIGYNLKVFFNAFNEPDLTVSDPKAEIPRIFSLSFEGRCTRTGLLRAIFWLLMLSCFYLVIQSKISFLSVLPVRLTVSFAFLVLYIRIFILRLHDMNLSGYFVALLFIPVINAVFLLALVMIASTNKENKYGRPTPSSSLAYLYLMLLLMATLTFAPKELLNLFFL
jgi:uncharacterized membrane protein YhaH (DUF805 family)